MIRKIIQIDEEKCNGCGACADACHEGAIGMVNGKARLLRDEDVYKRQPLPLPRLLLLLSALRIVPIHKFVPYK